MESSPESSEPANGAKRYTYNTAGFLLKVETYTNSWQTQAEMLYDGLGNRLQMTAAGLTTQYELDNGRVLSVDAAGNVTYYLYGLGPIGELTDAWNYALPDGANTPRQLVDVNGEVTFAASYTPWGDTLESHGTGSFTQGYFGGMMDIATGLIYVGNGQYYDPATGRFLTRQVNPNSTNPYVPWNFDPAGALIGPLALLSLIAWRKRGKPSKTVPYLFLLVFLVVLPLSVGLACGPGGPPESPPPAEQPGTPPPPTETPGPGQGGGSGTPTPPPPTSSPEPCPTPSTRNWLTYSFVITHYATVLESDNFFPKEAEKDRKYVPFYEPPFTRKENIHYELVPKYAFYVGNQCSGNCGTWRVSFQGSGKLTEPLSLSLSGGKEYVQADTNKERLPDPVNGWQPSAVYYFADEPYGACGSGFPLKTDATIAVPFSLFSLVPVVGKYACGDEYYIEGFGETKFMVTDRGTFDDPYHFDIYVGEKTFNSFYSDPNYKNTGAKHRVAKVKP